MFHWVDYAIVIPIHEEVYPGGVRQEILLESVLGCFLEVSQRRIGNGPRFCRPTGVGFCTMKATVARTGGLITELSYR